MTSDPTIELETFVESIDELHQLLSRIEAIKGIKRIETTFIRRIIRERYDWGTPGRVAKQEQAPAKNKSRKEA